MKKESFNILSWDVGIKNLAYCILDSKCNIIDWNIISIVGNNKQNANKIKTSELQINLINILDSLLIHFTLLNVKIIIIENQPAMKNPKIKSISNTLFDYFTIRGIVDKKLFDEVRFISPSNKLKLNIPRNIKLPYNQVKKLSIKVTSEEINEDELDYLNLFKKKDDLCDAYLQGKYYINRYIK